MEYSNLTNESLLDAEGEKTSALTNESLLDASGTKDFDLSNSMDFDLSNASGLDESICNALGIEPESNLTNESLLSADGYYNLTNESLLGVNANQDGAGAKAIDWLKSDKAKNLLDTVNQIKGNLGKGSGDKVTFGKTPDNTEVKPPKQPVTILGMHPVTFGVVAFGVLAVAGIVAVVVLRHKK